MNAVDASLTPRLRPQWLSAGGWLSQHLEIGSGAARLLWFPALLDRAATFTRTGLTLASILKDEVSIVAIDPPGYGASGAPIGVQLPPFSALQAWVGDVLDQLPGPKLLVGNSSGSVPVLAAAHRHDVAGIALVGWCDWRLVGPPPVDVLCPVDAQGLERLLALGWHRRPAIPETVLKTLLATTSSEPYRRHVESFDREVFGHHLDAYRGELALICGTSDGVTTAAMVGQLAAARPEASLHWIEDCGHYPHRETPLKLARILGGWASQALLRYAMRR